MMNIRRKERNNSELSDVLGMGSAFLCLLHCIAAPVLMGFGASIHEVHSSFFLHEFWDIIFLVLGFIAVYFSARHSKSTFLKVLLWTTYLSLLCAVILHHSSPVFEYLMYAASIVLIIAHTLNFRNLILQKSSRV